MKFIDDGKVPWSEFKKLNKGKFLVKATLITPIRTTINIQTDIDDKGFKTILNIFTTAFKRPE